MVAYSEEDMKVMIGQALKNPEEKIESQQIFLKKMFGQYLDDQSGMRVAEQLLKIATNKKYVNAS